MEFLAWIEASALATWVRESGSLWAYPTILTLHTFGLGVLVGANAAVDLRVLGFGRRIPLAGLAGLFRVMWVGFAINAVSGALLFAADATTKGTTKVFFVKLVFIALAVGTMLRLNRRLYGAGRDAAAITPQATRLAIASLVFWLGAITAGRFMAYV